MPRLFLNLPVTIQFKCLSILSACTKARYAICCRWNFILLQELRRRFPQLVAFSSEKHPKSVLKEALEKITARPNLAFVFYNNQRDSWSDAADRLLPKNTFLLAVKTPDIQSNVDTNITAAGGVSVMLGSYPEAYFAPFHVDFLSLPGLTGYLNSVGQEIRPSAYKLIKASLDDQIPPAHAASDKFWKLFIVFACGDSGAGGVESILVNLQRDYCDAAIIGGVCEAGDVRVFGPQGSTVAPGMKSAVVKEILLKTNLPENKFVSAGIVGLALGGKVPIQAIVSRGVKPVGTSRSIVAHSKRVSAAGSDSVEYICEVSPAPGATPIPLEGWVGRCIRESDSGSTPEYVGLRLPDAPGFTLHQLQRHSFVRDQETGQTVLRVATQANSKGAQINLYRLDGKAAIKDLDFALGRLQRELQSKDVKVMGALMFSCISRGPGAKDLSNYTRMMDAQRFENWFPSLPLCGCYTNGEIGPRAIHVDDPTQAVSRRGDVVLQGFSVVFGVFCCTTRSRDAKAREFEKLSHTQVTKYFQKYFKLYT